MMDNSPSPADYDFPFLNPWE